MALYYYDRHVADEAYTYSNPDSSWTLVSLLSGRVSAKTGYSFTAGAVGWSISGSTTNDYDTFIYSKSSNTRMLMYYNYGAGDYHWWYKDCTQTTNYSEGAFISTIQAEDGTYVDGARDADGYWYVKGSAVPTTSGFLALFY